MNLKTPDSSS